MKVLIRQTTCSISSTLEYQPGSGRALWEQQAVVSFRIMDIVSLRLRLYQH